MNRWWRGVVLAVAVTGSACASGEGAEMQVPVVISGGHETDPRDRGRPVVLVAAGLGVKPEVFREAFRGVTPARGGPPSREQAHANKRALLKVLGPHGVTNERLDEVSDYYRYQPERGGLWKNVAASAHAIVENGQVKRIVVTNAGAGYSSTPKATVKGYETVPLQVKVNFEKDLQKNGALAIELGAAKK